MSAVMSGVRDGVPNGVRDGVPAGVPSGASSGVQPFAVVDADVSHVIIEIFGGDNNLSDYVDEDMAEMLAGTRGDFAMLGLADLAHDRAGVLELSPRIRGAGGSSRSGVRSTPVTPRRWPPSSPGHWSPTGRACARPSGAGTTAPVCSTRATPTRRCSSGGR